MRIKSQSQLEKAYRFCEQTAKNHYENFPVASILLPKRLRKAIAVIYTFARMADEIADEGIHTETERLHALQKFWEQLERLQENKQPKPFVFLALRDVLKQHPNLPLALFFDLLKAFQQDVTQKTYLNFDQILDYCSYSANPIGRLLLHLTGNDSEENLKYSDSICSGLQLINFLQDLHADLIFRDRCYLPKVEMDAANISIEDLKQKKVNAAILLLIRQQHQRAHALLKAGAPLAQHLKGLFGLEVRFIIQGGLALSHALAKRQNPYQRPIIHYWQWPLLLCKSLTKSAIYRPLTP